MHALLIAHEWVGIFFFVKPLVLLSKMHVYLKNLLKLRENEDSN